MIPSYKDLGQFYLNSPAKETKIATSSNVMPVLKPAGCHAARDYLGQFLGRTVGLGVFVGIAHSGGNSLTVSIVAGCAGALAAGTVGFMLGKQQIGTQTTAQKVAVGLCTAAVAAAGASIAACGSIQPVAALAIGAATTAAASLLGLCLMTRPEEIPATYAAKMVTLTMATAASLTAASIMHPSWIAAETTLASRSIWIVAESSLIELCKSSFEQLGPSVDRQTLNFQGKSATSLIGLVPYVAATVIFNGYLSGLLQPANDSHEFMDLWGPLLVGALANAVKGASNAAAATRVHAHNHFVKNKEADIIRPNAGVNYPDLTKMGQKTAIRIFFSTCRNALYFHFREKGLSVIQAGCLAQGSYAFFAQNRDILFDLMQGEGWQEPVITVRSLPDLEAVDSDEVDSKDSTND